MTKVSCFILALIPLVTNATTWGASEVEDPIQKGQMCSVYEPASYGGYIYSWPSKYDQVFWPLTEEYGIWFCEKSGFTALIGDFESLTADEAQQIKQFLADNPPKDSSLQTKLFLLEKLYSMRQKDSAFANRLLRILARWNQQLGNLAKADEYRKVAFDSIKLRLADGLDGYQKLEYLYLAANYSKQFGDNDSAEKYLGLLQQAIEQTVDENVQGFAEYLSDLMQETKFITQGGELDPVVPEA